jgi:hypothetical protein
LGENIALKHLRASGWKKAKLLNEKEPNYPFDIIYDHTLVEVKSGSASNSADAMKWSLTFGERSGKAHRTFIRRASAGAKSEYYKRRIEAVFAAKARVVKEYEKRTGRKITVKTIGLIVDHGRRAADLYEINGIHKQIRWRNSGKSYKTTLRYS